MATFDTVLLIIFISCRSKLLLHPADICRFNFHPRAEPVFVNVLGTQKSIPPAFVAWRAGTSNRVVVPARQAGNRFLDSLKGLQIRALLSTSPPPCLTSRSNAASPYTLPTPCKDRHAITSHLLATF